MTSNLNIDYQGKTYSHLAKWFTSNLKGIKETFLCARI